VVEGPQWGHSVFTYYLLEGLRKGLADLNQDGVIPASELYAYLDGRVPAASENHQRPELWSLAAEKGEFVFLAQDRGKQGLTAQGAKQPSPEIRKAEDELNALQEQEVQLEEQQRQADLQRQVEEKKRDLEGKKRNLKEGHTKSTRSEPNSVDGDLFAVPQSKNVAVLDQTYETQRFLSHVSPMANDPQISGYIPPPCQGPGINICHEIQVIRLSFRPDGNFSGETRPLVHRGGFDFGRGVPFDNQIEFPPVAFAGTYTIVKNDRGINGELLYPSEPQKRHRFRVPAKYEAFWPPEVIVFMDGAKEQEYRLVSR
jgi:hypothetical protein